MGCVEVAAEMLNGLSVYPSVEVFVRKRHHVSSYTGSDYETNPIAARSAGRCHSLKLFNAALEDVFKLLNWNEFGININGEYITHLRFTDDIVIMAETLSDINTMLNDLSRVSQQVGLKMNMSKTKIMSNARVPLDPVIVESSALEIVDEYIYLRHTVQLGKSNFEEVSRRNQFGWAAFGKLLVQNSSVPEDQGLRTVRVAQ